MTSLALVRPATAVAWECRSAWALGRRVALSLDADVPRLEGHVQRVAASDAFVVVASVMVPLDRVLAVHWPSRLGDSTVMAGERWRGRARAPVPRTGQQAFSFTTRR